MLSRLDLDGLGSPADIAKRIHELAPDLPLDFTIEDICEQLDITSIEEKPLSSFEAMLLMDANKAWGTIVLAEGRKPQRRRFSIAHELGHFLIPTHKPQAAGCFSCSLSDLRIGDAREHNRAQRIEAEANRFAANLLMPPSRIRSAQKSRQPDLGEIVRLAGEFGVSMEAMARGYIEASREALAVVIARNGILNRVYRNKDFPWIEPRCGQGISSESLACDHTLQSGQWSDMEECDPEIWLGERAARSVEILSEQILAQRDGWATILLHAELSEH